MAAELHTEGLQHLLELMNGVQSKPANYYIGMATDASLAENASLASISELSGNGYSRQAVPSNGTGLVSAAAGTNDRKLTTQTVTFTATGGDWAQANTLFKATTSDNSGKLIASAPINSGSGQVVQDGHSYSCEMQITLAG